jgi:hypothetical protein
MNGASVGVLKLNFVRKKLIEKENESGIIKSGGKELKGEGAGFVFNIETIKCFKCGKKGHKANMCRSKTEKKGITCFKCGKAGHIKKDCKAGVEPKIENEIGEGKIEETPRVDLFLVANKPLVTNSSVLITS